MSTVYLIRHAHNDYVSKGKLPGWLPGIHLNELGQAQAASLGLLLGDAKLEAVYSSPLERAMETATEIAAAVGLKAIQRDSLGEIRIGAWEGLSLKSARRRKLWTSILTRPSLVRFPGGESFAEAQVRIVGEIEKLRERHSKAFACVSHADPIKLVIAHYIGLALDQFQRLSVDPASVSILQIDQTGARLRSLNDTRASRPTGAR